MTQLSFDRYRLARFSRTAAAALGAILFIGVAPPIPGALPHTSSVNALPTRADTDSASASGNTDRGTNRRAGFVITEDQLEEEQEYPLASVLVAHIPGIRVVHGPVWDRVARGINLSLAGTPCFVQLYMDGVYIADGDVEIVSVKDLATIEYRTPGNVPVQYQNRLPGAACGVLLLWSKI